MTGVRDFLPLPPWEGPPIPRGILNKGHELPSNLRNEILATY